MSAFEFFFSFYGLLLGLSVAAIAVGLATAIQHRRAVRIGWLTPLLALFLALDMASFWDFAWSYLRNVPFSYGLLVMGLVIATIYFIAASLVFPHAIEDGLTLDDHFWANKKVVLLLSTAANVVALLLAAPTILALPGGPQLMAQLGVTGGLYVLLIVPAAFTRRRWLFAILVGIYILLYLVIAVLSVLR
jgi:hypothetical protein